MARIVVNDSQEENNVLILQIIHMRDTFLINITMILFGANGHSSGLTSPLMLMLLLLLLPSRKQKQPVHEFPRTYIQFCSFAMHRMSEWN